MNKTEEKKNVLREAWREETGRKVRGRQRRWQADGPSTSTLDSSRVFYTETSPPRAPGKLLQILWLSLNRMVSKPCSKCPGRRIWRNPESSKIHKQNGEQNKPPCRARVASGPSRLQQELKVSSAKDGRLQQSDDSKCGMKVLSTTENEQKSPQQAHSSACW